MQKLENKKINSLIWFDVLQKKIICDEKNYKAIIIQIKLREINQNISQNFLCN